MSSVIPAFSKKGDMIIMDEACNESIINGCNLSRSVIKTFKHNDMEALGTMLEAIASEDKKMNRDASQQRRFIVVEGLYRHSGNILPLDKLMQLKSKYCFRVMIDESFSCGVLGKTGRGVTELYNVDVNDIEIIMLGMDAAIGAVGGVCAASRDIVDHQRLASAGYCFSAAAPPFLSAAACTALDILSKNSSILLATLNNNVQRMHDKLKQIPGVHIRATTPSVIIHLELNAGVVAADEESIVIQNIVNTCVSSGVGVSASKFAILTSKAQLKPSITLTVTVALTSAQIDDIAKCISLAVHGAIAVTDHNITKSSQRATRSAKKTRQ